MRLDTALSTIFQLVVLGTDCIGSCKSNYSLLKRTEMETKFYFLILTMKMRPFHITMYVKPEVNIAIVIVTFNFKTNLSKYL